MANSFYVVNPRTARFRTDVFSKLGYQPGKYQADLSTSTVAALVPRDFDVTLCDEDLAPIDFGTAADIVGISCRIYQEERTIEIADEFRRRSKLVVLGGPGVALSSDLLREHADVLVNGEAESVADTLFADLARGTPQPSYTGDRPDLITSPIPRWDLYPSERALMGAIQTSRGCPFDCEFCDVWSVLGRKQRFKSNNQVIDELQDLYNRGYRSVAITDDNFLVHRKRARGLLADIRDWNHANKQGAMALASMFSLDVARDTQTLQLAAEAGLVYAFIGIESSDLQSLAEMRKRQNLNLDIIVEMRRLLEYGILPSAGLIVGCDADDETVFERQYAFAMASPIPIFGVSQLTAVPETPLYERLMRDGRLRPRANGVSEIIPKQMSCETLESGFVWLLRNIYRPHAFGTRMCEALKWYRPNPKAPNFAASHEVRQIEREAMWLILDQLASSGMRESSLVGRVFRALEDKPEAETGVRMQLFEFTRNYINVHGFSNSAAQLDKVVAAV